MSFALWSLLLGALLLTMVLVSSLVERLPLSNAMIYLGVGAVLGPAGMSVLQPDPAAHAAVLERAAEIGLLISLFAVGLNLPARLKDRIWRLPFKLAFVSLAVLVALVAGVGVWALGLSVGAAVLLGAILAPTDPVLAAALQQDDPAKPDRLGFTLAAEGGFNDGAAFPFVVLGLAMLGVGGLELTWRWLLVDLLWATVGGILVGGLIGAGTGRLVVLLRTRFRYAIGLDVFLALGIIGTAYGLAHVLTCSGFLAVFAAGIALRRTDEQRESGDTALGRPPTAAGHSYETLASHSHTAGRTMKGSVSDFNEQIEKIAELGLVLVVGAMLPYAAWSSSVLWFVPLLLVVLRPLSVLAALPFERVTASEAKMVAWFGIRGIGSLFYLLFALRSGVSGPVAELLTTLVLWTICASIVLHGASASYLMRLHQGKED